MKLTKRKMLVIIGFLVILIGTFFWGGNYGGKNVTTEKGSSELSITQEITNEADKKQTNKIEEDVKTQKDQVNELHTKIEPEPDVKDNENKDGKKIIEEKEIESQPSKMVIDPKTGKDKYLTDPVPEGKPVPVEWQNVQIDTNTKFSCTLSVRCDTILDNLKIFNKDKLEVLPKDGVIFSKQKVDFYKGESVFNVLQREMKKNKIHMEFVMTPMYNSVYVEGINNLYEFDTGELSGWMYRVNGWFPNYGASRYQLQDGDQVEWVYTCDLGRDVGGYFLTDGEIPEDKKKILEERKNGGESKDNPSESTINP